MKIEVIDRLTQKREEEIVYGRRAIEFLYGSSFLGPIFRFFATHLPFVSAFYGWLQKRPASRKKIAPFVQMFNIDLDEYENDFASFNDFFIRKLKPGVRPIDSADAICPADGRYRFFPDIARADGFVVKGEKFCLATLLESEALAARYHHGSMVIARLAPPDYHRFHFAVEGFVKTPRVINGWLYSVNPAALVRDIAIFTKNKRVLTEVETPLFGLVVCLEIGATAVGSIHQTFKANETVLRGDEKGYFEFGASALILLFEKGKIEFDPDLLQLQQQGFEIKCRMGQSLGSHENRQSHT